MLIEAKDYVRVFQDKMKTMSKYARIKCNRATHYKILTHMFAKVFK